MEVTCKFRVTTEAGLIHECSGVAKNKKTAKLAAAKFAIREAKIRGFIE
jgi:hypothetical protein